MLSEGDTVPAFEMTDVSGSKINLESFRGTRHAIYFYPKDFTPGCTIQADEFSKSHAEFKKRGIEVIGVSPDGAESHKKFCEKMGIPYTLLSDPDNKVSESFGVWGIKKFMGREYKGVTRSTFLVDEKGTIFKAYRKVRPAGHASQVLDAFDEVGANTGG